MSGSQARELETEQPEVAAVEQPDVEARARRMGWAPKNEFRGDQARWMPAEDFLRRGEEELPIVRERLRKSDRILEETQRELGNVRGMMEEMRTAAQRAEQRAYDRAKAELTEQRAAAVQAADTAGFQAVEARMAALEADRAPAKTAPVVPANSNDGKPAPEIVDWVHRQPWWNKNLAATAAAVAYQQEIARQSPDMSINDNLHEVERRIRDKFPEEFPGSRREAPASVTSSSQAPPPRKSGKLTFDSLPADERADARKAFAKFKKQMPTYTEEEYLANYDWNT